jgi:5-methylcytosine-specific restriction endonuclease McrA
MEFGATERDGVVPTPLPSPGDPALASLEGLGTAHLDLYRFLYERRENPPTMNEIREFDRALTADSEDGARNQIDRRVRDLYVYFVISKDYSRGGRAPGYRLEGWEERSKTSKNTRISGAVRARVLAPQRCAMCGRTPLGHGVVIVVDHKLPQDWGGTNDEENLQPLCEECNGGKKAWFATYDKYAEQIAAATRHPEPQGRIGELLKVFDGELVPGDLISVVASMGAFQEDWQKRLRELRKIGWQIGHKNVHVGEGTRRVRSHYYLVRATPWPAGTIYAAVKAAEDRG